MAEEKESKNKRSLSERDVRLIYILLSLVVIGCAYFFGFKKLQEKKEVVDQQNVELQKEVNSLLVMVRNKDRVEADTKSKEADIIEVTAGFPSELRTQNVIYEIDKLEQKDKKLKISTETISMNQLFYQNGQLVSGDGTTSAATSQTTTVSGSVTSGGTGYVVYRSDVSINCKTSYAALKKLINFVNSNGKRMTLSEISVSHEKGSKNLSCSATINMYSLSGTDKKYEVPAIRDSGSGKASIFVGGKGKKGKK